MNSWKIRLAAVAALLTLGVSVATAAAKSSRGVAVIANSDGSLQFSATPVTIDASVDHAGHGVYVIKFPAKTWAPGSLPVPIFNTTNGATIYALHIELAANDGSETMFVTFTTPAQFNFLALVFDGDE